MNFIPFLRPPLLGLDIQPHGIYIIELQKYWRQWYIKRALNIPMPPAIFADGRIQYWHKLHHLLATIVTENNLAGRAVAVQLPKDFVHVGQFEVPQGLANVGIETEIAAVLKQQYAESGANFYHDFSNIAQHTSGYDDILFAATKKDYVDHYSACINGAGLCLKIIDVDAFALKHFVQAYLPALALTGLHIVLLARAETLLILGFDAEKILFYQSWQCIDPDNFYDQLQQELLFYLGTQSLEDVQHVFVLGVSTKQKEAVNNLSVQRIHYLEPLENMPSLDFACAYGLALRGVPRW